MSSWPRQDRLFVEERCALPDLIRSVCQKPRPPLYSQQKTLHRLRLTWCFMIRALQNVFIIAMLGLCVGCGGDEHNASAGDPAREALGESQNKLIYGTDDRRDFYDTEPGLLRDIGKNSVAAKISLNRIGGLDGNAASVSITASNLRQTKKLCPDERYVEQPAAANCSGTLIANDLLLTAGHCMTQQSDCDNFAWVFNFYFEDEDTLASIATEDVFRCDEIIDSSLYFDSEVSIDHSVVRLVRDATPRFTAVNVRTERTALSKDTPVSVIGFGLGIPMKFDFGGTIASVREETLDFFRSNSDAFVGNSGSGVFTDDGTLVGILVAGRGDFTFDAEENCNRLTVLPNTDAFEENSYGFRAIDSLCNSTARNDYALCAGRCGNDYCEVGESAESCAADCTEENDKCGNAACEADETSWSCPIDCDLVLPPQWTCDESDYASNNGCHCGCGIIDPDCAQPDQELFGCESAPQADTCSIAGECAQRALMCGNNTCDRGETAANCPIDCANTILSSGDDEGCSTTEIPSSSSLWLLLGMVGLVTLRSRRR